MTAWLTRWVPTRWLVRWRDRQAARLTERAKPLSVTEAIDLEFLSHERFVTVAGWGESITSIFATVTNQTNRHFHVIVKPGTYFVASGGHQNMVARRSHTLSLEPRQLSFLRVEAACINAGRPVPRESHKFTGVKRVAPDVTRFLGASESSDPMVIQAGVWALTDQMTRADLKTRLVSQDAQGNVRKDAAGNVIHPITDEHIDEAERILDELGIANRIWWLAGVAHERKKVTYENGTYAGEFRHGQRYGRGTYEWKDGSCYDGDWARGKKHGVGRWQGEDGVYDGSWKEDRRHGLGRVVDKQGGVYEGEWVAGTRHGRGKYVFPDGTTFEGRFANDRNEEGWQTSPDGERAWCVRDARGKLVVTAPPNSPP
jgi:hypothetical protein